MHLAGGGGGGGGAIVFAHRVEITGFIWGVYETSVLCDPIYMNKKNTMYL